ncbi:HemK2/MTQ2 family protein methyltransferase [Haloglomus litoreum]|uniref:HemK2/MTQ2 family protein methyltransferase n=1 Tax=Haloglomus litoreum TaxID=3034026 RepID=UPI0023E793E2|nr:HemK2/MTQ2 family protein methyltransferase [Haloglomus sp. DT116]
MPDDDRPRLADLRGEPQVYRAAEDSQLLATAAVARVGRDDLVLDLGTGSGYVGRKVAEACGARVVASDLNPHACRRARDEGLPAVRTDMVSGFRDDTFDWVLFNPPYLPTPEDQEWDDWMERALSGGEDGRAVVDPFLASVRRVLAPGGHALLLVSSLTGLDAVRNRARNEGLITEEATDEQYPSERLVVLELTPTGG